MNITILSGNLGAAPEIRYMPNGDKVASLRVATSEYWKDRNTGEKVTRTEWHNVQVYGNGRVDFIEKYIGKGDTVLVQGQNRTRKWQDQNGVTRYTAEVVIGLTGKIDLVAKRAERAEKTPSETGPEYDNASAQQAPEFETPPYQDDEIPF